jgi:hypothetical protein
MTETSTPASGGFTGDPAAALRVSGTSGCCGNPARDDLALPAATSGPCCGTTAEAAADDACCGTAAKSDAVTNGKGCCG